MEPHMPTPLEAIKADLLGRSQTYLAAMRDMIEAPDQAAQLKTSGHKTLESFLSSMILYTCRANDAATKAYERANPD